MTAMTRGRPYCAARTTDCGVPPTAIQAGTLPAVVIGKARCPANGRRKVPSQ